MGAVVSQDSHVLSLLTAAPLPHTHRARSGLHRVVAASALCLCLRFHFCASLLALPSSLSSQFSDNETTNQPCSH